MTRNKEASEIRMGDNIYSPDRAGGPVRRTAERPAAEIPSPIRGASDPDAGWVVLTYYDHGTGQEEDWPVPRDRLIGVK